MRNSCNHCFICLTLVFGSVQLTAAESATKNPMKKLEKKGCNAKQGKKQIKKNSNKERKNEIRHIRRVSRIHGFSQP